MSALRAEELVACGVPTDTAQAIVDAIEHGLAARGMEACWMDVTRRLLSPRLPFAAHRLVHERIFAAWPQDKGPRPAWVPTAAEAAASNIGDLMRERGLTRLSELHDWSVRDPSGFCAYAARRLGIIFQQPPVSALDLSSGVEHPHYLAGARFNVAESCFQATDDAPAVVWSAPGLGLSRMSYGELKTRASRVGHGLRAAGFRPGDAIAIYMPMTVDAVAIYLGIVLSGMVVVSIADSMAEGEVATRLRIAGARGIFTCHEVERGGKRLPLYRKVLGAGPPRAVVLDSGGQALRAGDLAWEDFLAAAADDERLVIERAGPEDTTNVLFSSGTTGDPKAIPWNHLTPIKAAIDGTLHLDIRAGDVVAWPTNLGWMMGPWLIYAALLNRATIALYLDAPTLADFGRFVQDARVTMLGLVPSIVKAWRGDGRMTAYDWSAIRCFGSTGEASNADDYFYLMMLAGYKPVIEYCGGTEIGGGYITGSVVQPQSPATFSTPALGSGFVLLDEQGQPADNGEVFLVPPALGQSLRLLNRDHHEVYFADTPQGPTGVPLRRHGDQIERLPGGYYRALGRVDDTMNLGGIKVSSAEIERVLETVDGVVRSAAIAVNPQGGGPSELVVFVVLRDGGTDPAPWRKNLQDAIKTRLNPLFRISDVVAVAALPVTASNKVMRRELRARYAAEHGRSA